MLKKIFFVLVLVILASPVLAADVMPYLAPDNSYGAFRYFLSNSDSNMVIAVYQFTSHEMARDLINSGKNITILVEGNPVGGLTGEDVLCAMQSNGINIRLYAGSYKYMHAKYIVSGNFSMIGTENFGDTGYPINGKGNRGWGAIIKDEKISDGLRDIFYRDTIYSGKFDCTLDDYKLNPKEGGASFTPVVYANQDVKLLAAPGIVSEIIDIINSAKTSVKLEQHYIHKYWGKKGSYTPNAFLEEAIQKAREGKDVKILLDRIWFNMDKDDPVSNYYTNIYINEIAEKENLTLESRLLDLEALELEKAHVKGVIIDDSTVFLSSVNWDENSPTKNREIGVLIKGNSADYYLNAFNGDWNGKRAQLLTGFATRDDNSSRLIIAIIIGIIIAIIIILWTQRRTRIRPSENKKWPMRKE